MNPRINPDLLKAQLALKQAAQTGFKRIYDAHKPVWEARTDALKTLASVSSASIVLSVTFSSSLISLNVALAWRYLMLFTFTMFVLSLISALIAIWVGIGLHALPATFFVKNQYVREEIEKLTLENILALSLPSSNIPDSMAQMLDKEEASIRKRDNIAGGFSRLSFVCFALAIISLAVIGFRQFLP